MPQEDAAALFAMLFGGYGGIKPELLEAFTATGIVHILSVSGSHIALLAGTLQQLGALLRLRPAATALLIAAAVCFYAALSGFVPPVIRSAAMGILAFTALALERENDARRLLALTALAMLIFSPLLFYDISFQLSFGATAGLLYIAPVLRARMAWLPPWLAANVALTSAAQLSVLPVLAWYFNALSLSALLANLVAVPLVEAIIVCGLIGALLGLFLPILQNIFFILCSLTLGLVYNITSALAALPGSNLYLPSLHPALGAVYYGVLGVAVWALQDQSNAWLRFFRQHRKGLFALLVGVGLVCFAYGIRPSPVYVHFIDVGQGDAALVTTPHGKALLIDTGGVLGSMSDFDVGERVIAPYLRHYGVRQLEYLILTHAHEDHAGGAAAVCRRFPVGHVIVGREDRSAYARVFQTSLERLPDCVPAYAGQTWEVDGVRVAVLHAADASGSAAGNEVSNVISLSYGAHRFLITGDLDAAGEEALLFSGADVKSTVLKVGHHGSKTSSSEAFIRRVGARYAVISVGADNRFGHPNPAVVKRLEEGGARVYRTDKDGAVLCATDGRELKITTFAEDG